MRVSLNWISEYLDFELPPIDELVERIGSQLGAVEEVENLGEKYKGIVVVKVVECDPLEDSDHLHRCLVDDGGVVRGVERNESGLVQVLTGAPNVHKDMMAVWLAPGVTVPDSVGKDPFVLESRSMRGAMSHGMLASPRELAIGEGHEGLLDLTDEKVTLSNEEIKPGADFAVLYGLNDYVIDIENKMFTHRPDCFGHIGVAREIAGILGHKFTSPERYRVIEEITAGSGLELSVENEIPMQVPRFMAVALKGITVKPSPLWLQIILARVGSKPISNVVDITNCMMLLTGQPLHAYDYDKVASGKLGVRFARPNEKLQLLNGKTIDLHEADMVITDGNKPVGLAGVMGGEETEVSNETKNIILECATFDMYAIRRTSMRHGLFTDAVTRYNKGQSPLQNPYIVQMTLGHLETMAGSVVASPVIDVDHTEGRTSIDMPVPVSTDYINSRLGFNLLPEEIKTLLENVECNVTIHGDELVVTAPYWRTDIELREDVVEEAGRLYGFDKLPLQLPKRDITPAAKNDSLTFKDELRTKLAKAGANEVLTYSFIHGDLMKKTGQNPDNAFQVSNALSPDVQYYRLSVMPSLLDKVRMNVKAGYDEFALFELGKTHLVGQLDDEGLPREDEIIALVVTANDKLKKAGAPYYAAKNYLESLITAPLTYKPVPADMQGYDITKPYDMNRTACVYQGDTFLGIIGEFRASVTRTLKLPKYCAGFELDIKAFANVMNIKSYLPISRFPAVWQDVTLKVGTNQSYGELYDLVDHALGINAPEDTRIALEGIGIYQAPDDVDHKSVTFRIRITGHNRTLTDKEVSRVVEAIAASAHEQLDAEWV